MTTIDTDETPSSQSIRIEITEAEAGTRVDRFLGNRFYPAYSRSFLTDLIAAGGITVNGRPVRPAYRLAQSDVIEAMLIPRTEQTPGPEDIPLDVLYQDEHILVVHKPAGMVVHPGSNVRSGTLANALIHHYPEISKVGLVDRPGIVHRLDAHTSGAMVVARTNPVRAALVDQFKAKLVKKEYRALVVGEMPLDADYIDLPLGPDPRRPERMHVDAENGKPSSTYYQVLERLPGVTWVAAMPHTGRTHQIRVHLAHLGYPIVNDPQYGITIGRTWHNIREDRKKKGLPFADIHRHALHAFRLTFRHPVTGEEKTFEAPVPKDMTDLLEYYRALVRGQ